MIRDYLGPRLGSFVAVLPVPGDGRCGLAAVAVAALCRHLDDEKDFGEMLFGLCGNSERFTPSHFGDLLWRYASTGFHEGVLNKDSNWREMLDAMRTVMLNKMTEMAQLAMQDQLIPSQSQRDNLIPSSSHLCHQSFQALVRFPSLQLPITLHFFDANDELESLTMGDDDDEDGHGIHIFHGPMNPRQDSRQTLRHYDAALVDFACLVRPSWLNEQARMSS